MTQRNFEILASGGFLLTSDTPIIRKLFVPGRDLIVSSSPEETIELIQYYLSDNEKRNIICKQGEFSVKPHSYTNRAQYMLKILYNQNIL